MEEVSKVYDVAHVVRFSWQRECFYAVPLGQQRDDRLVMPVLLERVSAAFAQMDGAAILGSVVPTLAAVFGLMLGVVALVWGAGPLAIGVAVGDGGGFGPLWLNGTRLLLAGVVLLGIAALRGQPVAPRGQLPLLVGLGLVG